jgi:tetratricopeptide (TPR) repeat protein
MIKERPLLGYGAGNMKVYYPLYHRKAVDDKESGLRFRLEQAHNDYVQILVELGIIGFILFGGLLIGFLFMVRHILTENSYPEERLVTIGIAGGVSGFAVQAVFSFPLQTAVPPFLLFAFLGISAAYYHKRARSISMTPVLAALILLVTLTLGILQTRYNIRNLLSAKYYYAALVAEKMESWNRLLQDGLTSYHYNPLRLQSLSMAARGYGETGQMEEAIRAFEKVTQKYPNDIVALSNLGTAYAKAGQNDKAVMTLERALKMYPDEPSIKEQLEWVTKKAKNPDRGFKVDKSLIE